MSAFANTSSINQVKSKLAQNNTLAAAVSDISVTTRIDYNLRFTKQAVLVVANDPEQYSQLASQFLVSLSSGHAEEKHTQINVAFVSASTKLNDIQIRCRVIEQLFVNTLFDPEQSLAVSVLKFAKQHGEAISIVIDHAHALSLQVKYELSQLVSLAKKYKLTINVVLFGLTQAAHQLSSNKSLFKNKMVIIDAETGHVLSFDDKKIQPETPNTALTLWQKLSLVVASVILIGIMIWGYQLLAEELNKQDAQSEAFVGIANTSQTVSQPKSAKVSSSEHIVRAMQKKQKTIDFNSSAATATSEEINFAILASPIVHQVKQVPAKANDVLMALSSVNNDEVLKEQDHNVIEHNGALIVDPSGDKVTKNPLDKKTIALVIVAEINSNYYQNQAVVHEQGYVIQIAGFTDKMLWQRFIKQHDKESLYSYQKLLVQTDFIVVTSKVYPTKIMAKAALKSLPASLGVRKPWLKDISSVINEINTFKG